MASPTPIFPSPPEAKSRFAGALALALVCLALPRSASLHAAPAEDTPQFHGDERVVAIDVVVEVAPAGAKKLRPRKSDAAVLARLRAEDFAVEFAGSAPPVVLAENPSSKGTVPEPWSVVLYFDEVLTSRVELAAAARRLSDVAAELVALGEVTLAVARPEGTALELRTRSGTALRDRLTQLSLEGGGEDRIASLRTVYLREQTTGEVETNLARAEERRIVRAWQDQLLDTVIEMPTPSSKRALVLITAGYDLEPGDFYRRFDPDGTSARDGEASASDTSVSDTALSDSGATDSLGRALAAYGWVTLALRPHVERAKVGGWGLGPFRIVGPSTAGIGVRAFYDGLWDPELAEGYLALGDAHLRAEAWDDATEAYEAALFHFRDRKATRERQAAALSGLAQARARLGQSGEARLAASEAVELDPSLSSSLPQAAATLLDPAATLERLTSPTSGAVITTDAELAAAIDSLAHRIRLTFQVSGGPAGGELPLEVRVTRAGFTTRAPRWGRTETPRGIAELRARRLLASGSAAGDLAPRVHLESSPDGQRTLVLRLPASTDSTIDSPPRALRLTLATATDNDEPHLESLLETTRGGEPWSRSIPLSNHPQGALIAIVIEELATGRWGGELIEVPPRPAQ